MQALDGERLADALGKKEGLVRLGLMFGLHSTKRGMDEEADQIERDNDDQRCLMQDKETQRGEESDNEAGKVRDIMSAGDVHYHASNEKSTTATGGISKVIQGGLAALGIGAALTLPILAWNMTRPTLERATPVENPQPELGARFVPVPQN